MDTLTSIVQTAKKLLVNGYEYLHDRISGIRKMPSLASLIRQRSRPPPATPPCPFSTAQPPAIIERLTLVSAPSRRLAFPISRHTCQQPKSLHVCAAFLLSRESRQPEAAQASTLQDTLSSRLFLVSPASCRAIFRPGSPPAKRPFPIEMQTPARAHDQTRASHGTSPLKKCVEKSRWAASVFRASAAPTTV